MDYTKEINAFIDWLETNPLDAITQALWFHLLTICHKSGSPEWFTVANLTLQAKLGVSDKTLSKHRNFLVQKGRIEYKSQGKQQAGKYHFQTFSGLAVNVNIPVKRSVKYPVKRSVKYPVNPPTLLKKIDRLKDGEKDTHDSWQILRQDFEKTFHLVMKTSHYDMINSYLDDGMQIEVILLALEDSKNNQAEYPKYLWRTLDSWIQASVKSITDYRRYIQQNATSPPGGNQQPKSFPARTGMSKQKDEILEKFRKAGLK